MKNRLFFSFLAWFLIIIGSVITISYLNILFNDGWKFWGNGEISIEKSGQFGDYIGGFIGTIFSLSGFIFLYITFKEQRLNFQKERFESKYFELLKLHRENLSELEYSKFDKNKNEILTSSNRKVFRIIYDEFIECHKELLVFNKFNNISDFIIPNHKKKLEEIIERNNLKIKPEDMAQIDIAYCILFYGVSSQSLQILVHLFRKKYDKIYFNRLLKYFQLKCKSDEKDNFKNWLVFYSKPNKEKEKIFNEIYSKRKSIQTYSKEELEFKLARNYKIEKYYGGHQHRLGHYFRHLFQSFKYINENIENGHKEKYFYGKTLRAQLSTYEQSLLFINSISCLGLRWELDPEIIGIESMNEMTRKYAFDNAKLISNFHLIKNLPGTEFSRIVYKKFYPNVKYESSENQ